MVRSYRAALGCALVLSSAIAAPCLAASTTAAAPGTPAVQRRSTTLFDGIELNGLQRTRVRLIQSRYADQMREISARIQPTLKELAAAQQRGDTAAAKRAWASSADDRAEFKAVGTRMRAEIREVLTGEQRTRFDANAKAIEARAASLDQRFGTPAPQG